MPAATPPKTSGFIPRIRVPRLRATLRRLNARVERRHARTEARHAVADRRLPESPARAAGRELGPDGLLDDGMQADEARVLRAGREVEVARRVADRPREIERRR